jgi:hypothetical protein
MVVMGAGLLVSASSCTFYLPLLFQGLVTGALPDARLYVVVLDFPVVIMLLFLVGDLFRCNLQAATDAVCLN